MPHAAVYFDVCANRFGGFTLRVRRIVGLAFACLLFAGLSPASVYAATTYYVDCSAGNDSKNGTSTSTAWRTVNRANGAAMSPGSKILFKRGCTFSGTSLTVKWNGTQAQPITIGAYGTGNRPLFQNAQDQFFITGSWLILEGLATRADPVTHDTQCQNAPAGRRTGFRLRNGGHNVLRDLTADNLFIGIWADNGSHHNKILNNTLTNNRMKSDIWTSDAGAVGIALHGDDNEVAYNTISGSDTCSRFYGRDGSAVEVYGGQRNVIHHNRAINNNNFTELGNPRSSDTTYAYNVVTSTLKDGHFLTTRGSGSGYGPVYRTKAYNNTVYLTGSAAYAIQCSQGCGTNILSLRNNIVWSADRIGHADAAFDEGDNVFWTPGGNVKVWFPMSSSSMKSDPRWVAPGSSDFRLQSASPAVNAGSMHAVNMGFTKDFNSATVPQGGAVDIGATEFGSGGSAPQPPPPPPPSSNFVQDSFTRTLSNGWGSAETGGSYSYFGPASAFSVQNGHGRMVGAQNRSLVATLAGLSVRDVEITGRVSTSVLAAGDGQWVYFVARRSGDGSEYRSKLKLMPDGRALLGFSRTANGSESPIAVGVDSGVTYAAGSFLKVRVSITGSGPTTLRMKVWREGQTEPGSWQHTATDGTSNLQDAGQVALQTYLPGNGSVATIRFDDLVVTSP